MDRYLLDPTFPTSKYIIEGTTDLKQAWFLKSSLLDLTKLQKYVFGF